MDDLLNALKNYISEKDTEYAFLITGKWGSGKTFFWKNNVIKMLENHKYNKLKPIYISLFGIDSIDDVIKQIAFQVYFSKNLKKQKILYAIVNYFPQYLTIDKLKPVLHYIIDFTKLFLCFDDLERTDISKKSILGFINLLVEHYKVKTLIICNEEDIIENEYTKF